MTVINYREMFIKKILQQYKDEDDTIYNDIKKELNKYNLMELKKYSEDIQKSQENIYN